MIPIGIRGSLCAAGLGLSLLVWVWPSAALARSARGGAIRSGLSPAGTGAGSSGPASAPGGPPLVGAGAAVGIVSESGEAPVEEADPLISNGLGSPTCHSSLGGELSASLRRDCETSGFIAAAAPTGDFGVDVHIDTGFVPLNGASVLSAVQSLFVTPVWMALVWLTHAVVVMLEWCFAIDLLEGSSGATLQGALGQAQALITTPWLALALSIAAIVVAYHGLVRRRVADTLGEALLTVAMFACGFWLMLDPAGTVGAIGRWSSEAGLGTLAVVVSGTPLAPARALGASMAGVYAASVEAPWCYLEFGNVGWCRDASRLEPRLRGAGLRIAAHRIAEAGCEGSGCAGSTVDSARRSSARLLREARTNGALFLALPANGPDRNSINDSGSLLRALCGSSNATGCSGPGASEAQFRTGGGTWPRVVGLLLIAIGLLGMLLLLGYIAGRLLLAAVLCVLYLLLAPGVVLAPAFGERGRALFRAWAVRLFGSVVAKLVFAFVLGAVLATTSILETLTGLGWWAQWLLMSTFWWGAFLKRNELLVLAQDSGRSRRPRTTRMLRDALMLRESSANRREARRKREVEEKDFAERIAAGNRIGLMPAQHPSPPGASDGSEPSSDDQATRISGVQAAEGVTEAEPASARLRFAQARLMRIAEARDRASREGDTRRARLLALRGERVEGELEEDSRVIDESRDALTRRVSGGAGAVAARARMLDEQAALPGAIDRSPGEVHRDYPALAGLAGYSRRDYEQLDPGSQRAVRLRIDRDLAERRRFDGIEERADGRAAVDSEDEPTGERSRGPAGNPDAQARRQASAAQRTDEESSVMRDARAVAEGRKRQLGFGRP